MQPLTELIAQPTTKQNGSEGLFAAFTNTDIKLPH